MKNIKKSVLNCVNIFPNGKRTSVGLSNIQLQIAKELAEGYGMKLNDFLCLLVKIGQKEDRRYGRCMAIRDGLLVELYRLITENNRCDVKVKETK